VTDESGSLGIGFGSAWQVNVKVSGCYVSTSVTALVMNAPSRSDSVRSKALRVQ
jgi:hypothetical protein